MARCSLAVCVTPDGGQECRFSSGVGTKSLGWQYTRPLGPGRRRSGQASCPQIARCWPSPEIVFLLQGSIDGLHTGDFLCAGHAVLLGASSGSSGGSAQSAGRLYARKPFPSWLHQCTRGSLGGLRVSSVLPVPLE